MMDCRIKQKKPNIPAATDILGRGTLKEAMKKPTTIIYIGLYTNIARNEHD